MKMHENHKKNSENVIFMRNQGDIHKKKVCEIIALSYSLGLNQAPPSTFNFLKSPLNKLRFFKYYFLL
jgi:hypothetical protein